VLPDKGVSDAEMMGSIRERAWSFSDSGASGRATGPQPDRSTAPDGARLVSAGAWVRPTGEPVPRPVAFPWATSGPKARAPASTATRVGVQSPERLGTCCALALGGGTGTLAK
jgi:hypothetical protein